MRHLEPQPRVLAIDPFSKGFAYVVLEGPRNLVDWGGKDLRTGGQDHALGHLRELFQFYQPEVFVAENCAAHGSRRGARAQSLIEQAARLAASHNAECHLVSRSAVRATFSRANATTKHQIATAIATLLPDLKGRLPPFRKPWMSEDARMGLFDAASFALTYYGSVGPPEH